MVLSFSHPQHNVHHLIHLLELHVVFHLRLSNYISCWVSSFFWRSRVVSQASNGRRSPSVRRFAESGVWTQDFLRQNSFCSLAALPRGCRHAEIWKVLNNLLVEEGRGWGREGGGIKFKKKKKNQQLGLGGLEKLGNRGGGSSSYAAL